MFLPCPGFSENSLMDFFVLFCFISLLNQNERDGEEYSVHLAIWLLGRLPKGLLAVLELLRVWTGSCMSELRTR